MTCVSDGTAHNDKRAKRAAVLPYQLATDRTHGGEGAIRKRQPHRTVGARNQATLLPRHLFASDALDGSNQAGKSRYWFLIGSSLSAHCASAPP